MIWPPNTQHTGIYCWSRIYSCLTRWKIGGTRAHWTIEILKASQANVGCSLIRAQVLGLFLHGSWLHSMGYQFCPLDHLYFFMEGGTFLQLSSSLSLLSANRILGVKKHLLILFHLCLLQSKLAMFPKVCILRNL